MYNIYFIHSFIPCLSPPWEPNAASIILVFSILSSEQACENRLSREYVVQSTYEASMLEQRFEPMTPKS